MGDQTRFIILAGPRTGSTYLVDYLDAAPGTRCLSELFQDDRIDFRTHQPADPRLRDVAFRDADPVAFLDLLAQEAAACERFGFKMIGNHIASRGPDFLRQICVSRAWKKIYLWRDDLFEQSASFLLAHQHFGGEIWGRTPDQRRIAIAPRDMVACLHMVQTLYFLIESALAAAQREDVFALEYGELGRPSVMADLLRFLGLPPAAVDLLLERRASDPKLRFDPGPRLAERVVNYDELLSAFRNSRYRRLIGQ